MKTLIPTILTALLIVISDPYKDIREGETDSYIYETQCRRDCIGYTESEGWKEESEEVSEDDLAISDEEVSRQVISIAKQIYTLQTNL